MTIIWRAEAEDKYLETLDYLTDNFSLETAMELYEEVTKCTTYLANSLVKTMYSKKLKAHKITIKKYNILVYRMDDESLYILDFIATRTNHKINQ